MRLLKGTVADHRRLTWLVVALLTTVWLSASIFSAHSRVESRASAESRSKPAARRVKEELPAVSAAPVAHHPALDSIVPLVPGSTVSAASFEAAIAPDALVSTFGANLATQSAVASGAALPTILGETQVLVTDSAGNTRLAQLTFVSPGQINYLLPAGTQAGISTITVQAGNGNGTVSTEQVIVSNVAPALFTANGTGIGVASGYLLRVKADGQQSYESIAQLNPVTEILTTKPIDLGPEGEHVFLTLFLSGLRHASDPNGDGNANETVRLLIGGIEVTPLYAGTQGSYAGLDQLNAEIPRSLIGRGVVSFSVTAPGGSASNTSEIEIAAQGGGAPPSVSPLSAAIVRVGQTLEIEGSGFSTNSQENLVRFASNDLPIVEASAVAATATKLTINVPFGAGTGALVVRTEQGGEGNAIPVAVQTSISGFVQEYRQQDNQRVGIKNIRVSAEVLSGSYSADTNADGSFVIFLPEETVLGQRVDLRIDPTPSGLPFPAQTRSINSPRVHRDNQYKGDGELANIIELKRSAGISTGSMAGDGPVSAVLDAPAPANPGEAQITTGQVTLDTNNSAINCPGGGNCSLTLTVLDAGRTPSNLPAGYFSSTIAQITPFGATLTPGGKLTFPNTDNIPVGTPVRLFKFNQTPTPNSKTLGSFVDVGAATVSSDRQRIETAANAITETSYYFVSRLWPTAALYGHVVESDGSPVRRAVVSARGQATFTDGNGGFVLRNVPVLGASDKVTLEVSFQRPDGTISRTQRTNIAVTSGALILVTPDLILPPPTVNRGPVIIAPASLSVSEGETRNFDFVAVDPDSTQALSVTVSGAGFASITSQGNGVYTLRLTPGTGSAGNYVLTLTASDSTGGSITQALALAVAQANQSVPVALAQSVATDEDTTRQITLTSSNVGATPGYTVVTLPLHGTLSGTVPALTYKPAVNYNGPDSFTFKVSSGAATSNVATVFIAVRPINDAPVLTVPGAQTVSAGQALAFIVSATDVDAGQTLTLTATNLPPSASFTPVSTTSYQFSWTPLLEQAGSYVVSFKVQDDGAPTKIATKTVTITAGGQLAKTSGPESGDIQALLVSGTTLYATTAGAGVYRSTDQGRSWTAVNDGLDDLFSVRSLAVIGDSLIASLGNLRIYRSTDNGQHWTKSENGLTSTLGLVATRELAVSGANLLVATNRGIYRSADRGVNWVAANTGLTNLDIRYLAANGPNVVAGTFNNGLFRSTDGGQSWLAASAGLTNLDIRAIDAIGTDFYVGTSNGAFRSTNQGQSWMPVGVGLPATEVYAFAQIGSNLFAGTRSGVFVSANQGQSWTGASTGLPSSPIQALGVSGARLFAGAGNSGGLGGRGVFVSTDQGRSWVSASSGITNPSIQAVVALGTKLFAATYGSGLYVSDDQGQTWKSVNATSGLPDDDISDLAVVGTNLFAAVVGSGVYRSTNQGVSWTAANLGLTSSSVTKFAVSGAMLYVGTGSSGVFRSFDQGGEWMQANFGLTNLTVNSLAATGSNLYAATIGGGVFRSTNQGASWTAVNTGLNFLEVFELAASGSNVFAANCCNGGAFSTNSGQSWTPVSGSGLPQNGPVGSLVFSGTKLYAGAPNGIYVSSNFGENWTTVNADLKTIIRALVVNDTKVIAGTYNGVFISADTGQRWTGLGSLANPFVNVVAANGANLYAGTLGSGVFRSTNGGTSWATANVGLPANADVQAIIASANGTNLFAAAYGDGVFRSTNQGQSWTAANSGLTNKFVNALAVSGTALYAGTNGGVFRSLDQGTSWTAVNNGLTNLSVLALAASGAALYAGTDGGGVFISTDGGANWSASNAGLTRLDVRSLFVSNTTLFAGTLSGGVFRSTDGGVNWTPVNAMLPQSLPVFSFAASGRKLYAATVYGVFVSTDQGASWRQINAGLSDIYITSLAMSGNMLYAGTRIVGVFSSQIPNDDSCTLAITTQPSSQSIISGKSATLSVAADGTQLRYQWYRGTSGDTSNRIANATLSSFTTPTLTATTNYWVLVSNACGSVNSATAAVVIETPQQADLALTQTVTPNQVTPGTTLTYTLTLKNNGPASAFSVALTDILPSAVTYVSCTATGGVCNKDSSNNNLTVSFNALLPAATATITVVATVNPGVAGGTVLSSTASASAATSDLNLANNSATATSTVTGGASTISGAITYGTSVTPKAVPGVMLTAMGTPSASGMSNNAGNYNLTNLGGGSYTITPNKTGDVNGISSFDASLVAQFAAGLIQLSPNQRIAADASGNGTISSFDASLIAQAAAGGTNIGIAGTWKFAPSSHSYPTLSGNLMGQNFDAILVGDVSGNWTPPASIAPQAEPLVPRGSNLATPFNQDTTRTTEAVLDTTLSLNIAESSTVTLTQVSSATGTSIIIPITTSDLTGLDVTSYDFTLTFDPSVLQLSEVPTDASGTLSSGWTIVVNAATPGRLTVSAFGATALAGAGTLLNLKFNVVGATGASSALNWQSFVYNEGRPSVLLVNGSATVNHPSSKRISTRQSSFMTTESVRKGLLNCARSPAFFPGTGKRRAESGLRSLIESAATSRMSAAIALAGVSPGNGTTSRPVPQTLE